jgi:small subunit ribosomal protein S17
MEQAVKSRNRKVRIGQVVSNKMDKSIVVAVERKVKHPIYKKYYKVTKKYMAHDDGRLGEVSIGDTVRIMEVRPLSRRKRWTLMEIIEKVK